MCHSKLEQAARQALEALEKFGIEVGVNGSVGTAITALREALAEQKNHDPRYISQDCAERGCACHYSTEVDGEPVAVYAAPVRTKDLTDDEIDEIESKILIGGGEYIDVIRAVIAADREKNK